MNKVLAFLKKEPMPAVSLGAALLSLFLTPLSRETLGAVDWKTLAILLMLLCVLDGFKTQNLFLPLIRFSGRLRTPAALGFFLVYGVFFSSMFVTNDVSLLIFVPLTILLFRLYGEEERLLPVLAMENVAAVRGSLLTPFGSPQNLFLFANSTLSTGEFLGMMLPLWLGSMVLIALFLLVIYRKGLKKRLPETARETEAWTPENRKKRILYLVLFCAVLFCIVSRTGTWPFFLAGVVILLLCFDRRVFLRVDYALLFTFFCFFIFSAQVAANPTVGGFLRRSVAGREYLWALGLSQIISNVPAGVVLFPFSGNLKALIYGLDTAGLVTVIGSLASVINLRLYTREYPGGGKDFLKVFEIVSLCFFAIAAPLQLLLM